MSDLYWAKAQLEISAALNMMWADQCRLEPDKKTIIGYLTRAQEYIRLARIPAPEAE